MKRPHQSTTNGLFPDTAGIQRALEHHTRTALLRRHRSQTGGEAAATVAEKEKAKGIGFAVDLVRAVRDGIKTQTRRLMRPQPVTPPRATVCPVATPNALLYVREPWVRTGGVDSRVIYAADGPAPAGLKFKPGMYMPRDLARLWLRVTAVRAERLSAMSDADLAAEGLPADQSFEQVWNTFYTLPGQRFADDPWVWVIGFQAVQ